MRKFKHEHEAQVTTKLPSILVAHPPLKFSLGVEIKRCLRVSKLPLTDANLYRKMLVCFKVKIMRQVLFITWHRVKYTFSFSITAKTHTHTVPYKYLST